MKFGFVTCVRLGLSCIEKIYEINGKLDLLITLHDHKAKNKSGRIFLDQFSEKNQIPLLKINNINDPEVIDAVKKHELDWLFIIGWSQIAAPEILNAPKFGCIGMHPTLLPVGRGRASIPWAIIKGVEKTGVSMFVLDEGVDTGPLISQYEIPLEVKETATTLYKKVEDAHATLMSDTFPQLQQGSIQPQPQNEELATNWEGRKPEDGQLHAEMNCSEADRLIRATTHPYPGAFYQLGNKKVIVWSAKFSDQPDAKENFQIKDGYILPQDFQVEYV